MSTSRYQTGLQASYNYGSVADVQAGGGLIDSLKRANKFAKDYRLVSRLKGVSDALGATEFIDKRLADSTPKVLTQLSIKVTGRRNVDQRSPSKSICMKCKKKTDDSGAKMTTSNGRTSRKSTCKVCGTKKSVFVSKQSGGNPLLLASTLAQPIGDVVSSGINAIDKQAERGFQKNQMTGKYDRKQARNDRAVGRKNLDNDLKMTSKIIKEYKERGIKISPAEAMQIARSY